MNGYTFESSRRMTAREQTAYDMGYEIGKRDSVKHGRWVDTDSRPHLAYECSECKVKWYGKPIRMNYCPNCGAKMDLEG